MKNLLIHSLFSILLFFGCNNESEVTSPVGSNTIQEPNWIALPPPEGLYVNTEYNDTRSWDGKKSGTPLSKNASYYGWPFGLVTINASLSSEKNSYPGIRTLSMTLETNSTVVTFGPEQVFNIPLKYNVTFTGVDLSGINPATVQFAYIAADGSVQYAVNDGIIVNLATGKLGVINARIPHFSRYGFIN